MSDLQLHVIHSKENGELGDTTVEQLDAIVDALKTRPRVVLHFHGGLVDKRTGMDIAERLHPVYEEAGAYPVFFVWSSGLLEILGGNLREIAGEDFFKTLLRWVTKYAVGKLRQADMPRGTTLQTPSTPTGDRDLHGPLACWR